MAVEKIQVVGAGQMGSGIAQVAAQAGLSVHLSDVDEEAIERGLETIRRHLARSVEKELISQDDSQWRPTGHIHAVVSTAVCTVIEPPALSTHASLLRRSPAPALVGSRCCGSTSLQTALSTT